MGEFDAALAALEEGLTRGERIGDERFVSRFLNTVAWLRVDRGDWGRGLDIGRRSLEMARRSRHATGLERVAFIPANQSVALVATGDLAEAAAGLDEAHHIVRHPPPSRWTTWRYATTASRASASCGSRAAIRAGPIGEARQRWEGHEALARLHGARGRADAALECYGAGRRVIEWVLANTTEAGLRAGLAGSPEVAELLARGPR